MIVPVVKLSQSPDVLCIALHLPLVKLEELDIFVLGCDFKVWCPPFFLRLHLPGPVHQDDTAQTKAHYDRDSGWLKLELPKVNPGEHFYDLDMLTKMMQPRVPGGARPVIEVVSPTNDKQRLEKESSSSLIVDASTSSDSSESDSSDDDDDDDSSDSDSSDSDASSSTDSSSSSETPNRELLGERASNPFVVQETSGKQVETLRLRPAHVKPSEWIREQGIDALCFDWEQTPATYGDNDNESRLFVKTRKYGFNRQYERFFDSVHAVMHTIVDVVEPDRKTDTHIRRERLRQEDMDFQPDRYACDTVLGGRDPLVQDIVKWQSPWQACKAWLTRPAAQTNDNNATAESSSSSAGTSQHELDQFIALTDEHIRQLLQLKNVEYLISPRKEEALLRGLVDIVFAICYDLRINQGEPNVQSPWAICKLSPLLSWLDHSNSTVQRHDPALARQTERLVSEERESDDDDDDDDEEVEWGRHAASLEAVVVGVVRRCCCYPLYRNWEVMIQVLDDVRCCFFVGKRALLYVLLTGKTALDRSDTKFYLSRLYLNDYCVWIQQVSDTRLKDMWRALRSCRVSKCDTGWDLEGIEQVVQAMQDQGDLDED